MGLPRLIYWMLPLSAAVGPADFMDVTTVLLFVTGVQLLPVGMIADVINMGRRIQ